MEGHRHPRPSNHIENLVGEKYQIQSHKVSDDYLDVYVVTDAYGRRFEAQAFVPVTELPREREGLYQARRRRMRRICRSPNFTEEFEHDGRRFLVSKVHRSSKEWADLQAMAGGRTKGENLCLLADSCTEDAWARTTRRIGDFGVTDTRVPGQQVSSYAEAVAINKEYPEVKSPQNERQRVYLSLGRSRNVVQGA
ncbi:uncharacterized protein CTRU02_213812 [Colletotrichum truncatum]|uniref:Uncharacterized protein n=1 Tax=Colletotrichum truncatum TaxID=5467 RepID=A0ACC3YGW4_COLTU|nr:uncharacterized protein CTRU02_12834 [Colletotrichum truncatum]KAF6784067.1 hypothetical protein CTRU02_12834 [Colletotrichum truncatum]